MINCGHGYKGQCCCECEHQFEIHVCGCGKCSKVTGYICTIFWEMSKAEGKNERIVTHSDNEHGCCEMWHDKRKKPKTYVGEEMLECRTGIYKVFWKCGGSSIAAIGITFSGQRWIAPTNWTNGSDEIDPTGRLHTQLDDIDKIILLRI